jgi:glycosyltransferase involved in cell wall biosynthesis
MGKIACKWVGAVFDSSGYASASRSYIGALLDRDDIDLSVASVSFEKTHTTHGPLEARIREHMNRAIPHKIQINHLTPQNYTNVRDPNAYNIAYTVWETDTLPKQWVDTINGTMDEVWVPSTWNKEVFESSGVDKPVFVIPHGIALPDLSDMKHISIGTEDDVFVFYSIFQWIERKNPMALLRAYLTEFKSEEKVCLALKTYRLDCSAKEQAIIKQDISTVKNGLQLDSFPPIRFFGTLLPSEYMKGLHSSGDCFVLPHRAEGFGIPHAEAMSYGNPVISSNYSGNLEFMNNENSYLINSREYPVCNMIFPNYNGHMTWGDPDVMHLRSLMRFVFENRDTAKKKGEVAKKYIEENLSWEKIGDLMVDRLKEISKDL